MSNSDSGNIFFGIKFQDFSESEIKRFDIFRYVGKGSFGTVVSAKDLQTNSVCAIKKIHKVFRSINAAKRVLREVRLLRLLKHENLLYLKFMALPPDPVNFENLYLVTDCMDTDLHTVIQSSQVLNDRYISFFVYQMLRGLAYLHKCNVIHRDIKPTNLLLMKNCELKICDFGLARVDREIKPEDNQNVFMTEHVVTRWYRAPEVILSWGRYSKAIDIWSVGCIMGELLGRKPLFAGKNYIDQLELITDALGKPNNEEIDVFTNERARKFMRRLKDKKPIDWKSKFPHASSNALDLLKRMLIFDANKRITAADALKHPYFSQINASEDSNINSNPDPKLQFDFEEKEMTMIQIRQLIYEETLCFHPEVIPIDITNPIILRSFKNMALENTTTHASSEEDPLILQPYKPKHRHQPNAEDGKKSIVSGDEDSDNDKQTRKGKISDLVRKHRPLSPIENNTKQQSLFESKTQVESQNSSNNAKKLEPKNQIDENKKSIFGLSDKKYVFPSHSRCKSSSTLYGPNFHKIRRDYLL